MSWASSGLPGLSAGDPEEGPQDAPPGRRHTRERARPRTPGEAEEHLLGLVVEGVAEEDGHGVMAFGGVVERGVPGSPRRGLHALAGRRHLDPDHVDGRQTQRREPATHHRRDGRRVPLQTVVDDDGARAQREPGSLEGRRHRQRERVCPAATRHEHRRAGSRRGQDVADGVTDRGRGGVGSGHGSSVAAWPARPWARTGRLSRGPGAPRPSGRRSPAPGAACPPRTTPR